MRTLISVFAGYAIFVVSAVLLFRLTGAEPHEQATFAFMAGTTLYGMFFAAVAGYVATLLARGTSALPALAVCIIIAVLGGVALLARPDEATRWSQLATVFVMAPMSLVGGLVRLRRVVPQR